MDVIEPNREILRIRPRGRLAGWEATEARQVGVPSPR